MFRKTLVTITILSLIVVCVLSGVRLKNEFGVRVISSRVPKMTEEALYNEITCYNLQHPEVVFAQAVLETGYFKSKLLRTNNNLFGMRHPKVRPTTSIGAQSGHAKYNSWQDSVEDYALWQQFCFKKKVNRMDYLSFLSRNYAEDTSYVLKLLEIIKKYKHEERRNSKEGLCE